MAEQASGRSGWNGGCRRCSRAAAAAHAPAPAWLSQERRPAIKFREIAVEMCGTSVTSLRSAITFGVFVPLVRITSILLTKLPTSL